MYGLPSGVSIHFGNVRTFREPHTEFPTCCSFVSGLGIGTAEADACAEEGHAILADDAGGGAAAPLATGAPEAAPLDPAGCEGAALCDAALEADACLCQMLLPVVPLTASATSIKVVYIDAVKDRM